MQIVIGFVFQQDSFNFKKKCYLQLFLKRKNYRNNWKSNVEKKQRADTKNEANLIYSNKFTRSNREIEKLIIL